MYDSLTGGSKDCCDVCAASFHRNQEPSCTRHCFVQGVRGSRICFAVIGWSSFFQSHISIEWARHMETDGHVVHMDVQWALNTLLCVNKLLLTSHRFSELLLLISAIPSLRARDCSKNEKEALNYLFLMIPLLNIIIPFFWKSFAVVWSADTIAFLGMYAWKVFVL